MLEEFVAVNDNVTVYRFSNGWMVEVSGKDSNEDWPTKKIACPDLDAVSKLLVEYANIPVT